MANYKETLNILKTNFEMKANLPLKEPLIQNKWVKDDIYQKVLNQNKSNNSWILHDGPPYANGDIHVGHALNKILKDIHIRYHLLNGFYSPFICGWDTHGLPIEHALLKKGGNKELNLTTSERRDNCEKFAISNVEHQLEQFKKLGLATNFDVKYLTLYPEFQKNQLLLFLSMVDQKLAYQDFKPVYWSWSSHSALAEAEIEYADHPSHSIYITFNVVEAKSCISKNDKLLVWTTTPWTIPSNQAIAVHPDYDYVRVECNNQYYVIGKTRLAKIAELLQWKNYNIVAEFKGRELEGAKYSHPYIENQVSPVILAKYVTDDNGTCLVHNASGFGVEDYNACKAYNIPVYCPIDAYGKFTSEVNDKELEGLFYEQSNDIVISRLEKNKSLLYKEQITHSVAIDWRTKKPIMFRATKQWFVNLEKINKDLLDAIEKVGFVNLQNKKQLIDMINNRKEWCISRQRVWGVPLPIIYDAEQKPITDHDLINNIIEIMYKEGINVWYEKPVEYFLTPKYLSNCQGFTKEKDIMDVWFDSGSSYNVLKTHNLSFPADLYLEGVDQYRGWFNSSLICSVIQNKTAPYKNLISHGFTLDDQGRKMSKSLGNVIDPLKVCSEYGADILRLWVASVDYQIDVKISKNILARISEVYRRIRNSIFKFILSNIADFDYEKHATMEFDEADALIINQLQENLRKIIYCYEKSDFATIVKIINMHAIDLSSWYFDLIKDTLYCDEVNNPHRRSIQTILYWMLKTYMFVLEPIMPHTCEEVYTHANFANKKESILLDRFLTMVPLTCEKPNATYWNYFFKLKDKVYAELEKIRKEGKINKSNQADLQIRFDNAYNFTPETLKRYLNVASVTIIDDKSLHNQFDIKCACTKLVRCERCWNYHLASEINEVNLCKRCANVLAKKRG